MQWWSCGGWLMVLWCYGVMVLWCYGVDVMVLDGEFGVAEWITFLKINSYIYNCTMKSSA
jgi:hypothetical protein